MVCFYSFISRYGRMEAEPLFFAAPALAPTHLLPTCEVGTIVGTASASAAHILLSQQRHGHGSRRRQLRVVPKSPRGGERPRHLADVRTRRPNPTANRENRRPGRASLPSVWTIHPSHSRAYKNLRDHTPSQLTKPDQANLSSSHSHEEHVPGREQRERRIEDERGDP